MRWVGLRIGLRMAAEDYDRECHAVSPDNTRSHLGGRKGRLPTMTFEQLLEAAHWTPAIFTAIDGVWSPETEEDTRCRGS